MTSLVEGKWLAPAALLVAETAEDEPLPVSDVFRMLDDRVYGDSRVSFWKAPQ
jgi:16S rRNA G966 N2-methylase RsmD